MADRCIQSNADIAGIGTRINFYVTIVLTALIPENDRTVELLDGLYKNAVLYGLGLILTAGIQTLQNQLDLYHAIFVMQIIFSLDFVYAYGQRRFIIRSTGTDGTGGEFRMKIFIVVQTLSTILFTVWLLYVWIKDSKFGSQPECNHLVKYVLVFRNVRVTETWLQVLFIAYLALNSCMMLLTFGAIFMKYLHKGIQKKLQDVVVRPQVGAEPAEQDRRPHEGTASRRVRVYLSVIPAAYGVATLELIVQRNRPNLQPGEDAWGFGQIIALVLIIGSVIDILATIRKYHRNRVEGTSPEEAKLVHLSAPAMPSAPRRHFSWVPSSLSS